MRRLTTVLGLFVLCATMNCRAEAGCLGRLFARRAQSCYSTRVTYAPACQAQTYQTIQPSPQYLQPAAPAKTTPQVSVTQTTTVVVTTDPYGFEQHVNYYRALHGLGPVRYSAHLAGWALQNSLRGFGHTVRMGRRQNAAMAANAAIAAQMWYASGAHRDAMLDPTVTTYGIAMSGNVWTLNLD